MGRAHEVRKAAMAKTNAAKTKVYSKFGKEILLAAKAGVPDPDMNVSLKRAIERAKKAQVPADLIKRAIDKVKSGDTTDLLPATYEAFGPGASTIIVECLTDNMNRTISDVRSTITKNHGKVGVTGCVSHMYNHCSMITCKGITEDTAVETLLMADVDFSDMEQDEEYLTVYGDISNLYAIKEALEQVEGCEVESYEITYLPDEYVTLQGEDKELFERMLSMLEDLDDVQDVYHNVEL